MSSQLREHNREPYLRLPISTLFYETFIWTAFCIRHPEAYFDSVRDLSDFYQAEPRVDAGLPYSTERTQARELTKQLLKTVHAANKEIVSAFPRQPEFIQNFMYTYLEDITILGMARAVDLIKQDPALLDLGRPLMQSEIVDTLLTTPAPNRLRLPLDSLLGGYAVVEPLITEAQARSN